MPFKLTEKGWITNLGQSSPIRTEPSEELYAV